MIRSVNMCPLIHVYLSYVLKLTLLNKISANIRVVHVYCI